MNYILALLLTLVMPAAFADTVQFCTATPATIANVSVSGKYTATVASSSTLYPGACNPQPVACKAPIVVPSATVGITSFKRMTGYPLVDEYGAGSQPRDITSFDAIYGPWPGNTTISAAVAVPINTYISEKFIVPHGYIAGSYGIVGGLYGSYAINSSTYTAPVSFTISTCPGDFSNPAVPNSTVVPGCWKNLLTAASHNWIQWRNSTTCILKDDTTYYLNIINANISNVGPNGTGTATSSKNANCGATCADSIRNGPGNFSSYHPK